MLPTEIELMYRVIGCKGCIQIYDFIEKIDRYMIIMERPKRCIDLWDYINNNGPLDEGIAKMFFMQIVRTVEEMKARNVMHCDIKDENILVDLTTLELKLIDFGAGTYCTDGDMNDFQGTRVYSPPEFILDKLYKPEEATVWSLGILLFDLIYGDVPFESDFDIINCKVKLNDSLNRLKHDLKSKCINIEIINDLIFRCLQFDLSERIKLEDILKHRWFTL